MNFAAATLRLAATASLLAIAAPAFAQDQTEPAAEDQGLGDIVVTATRREEQSRNVPVAVSVISGEKLDVLNSSGLDIRFLSSRTPSLQIESSFGRTFPRFYIRGLGNTDFDPNAAQPVSVVYDDVALENPMLKSFPVFDLASVQVLRGPQGTLFGRNTPAGVVKLDSAKPDADRSSMQGSISLGTYNTLNTDVAANVPLGGGFALRVSGLVQYRDNWVTNTNTNTTGLADRKLEGYSDKAGRVQLGYSSADFNAILNVHGRDLETSPRTFRAGLFAQGSNRFVPAFDKDRVSLDGLTSQTLSQWGTNLRLDYHVDGVGTFYSVTGYERAKVQSTGDIDGGDTYTFNFGGTYQVPATPLNVGKFASNTGGLTKPKEFSQELRFATDDLSGLRLQGGLYYFHQDLDYTETSFAGTTVSTQNVVHTNTNENIGVFGSAEYRASDALTLRAGVRYSHDKKRDIISGFTPDITAGLVLPLEARTKGSNVSWDASATYKLTDQVNFYARAATGYLPAAIQDRITFGSVQTIANKQTTFSGEAGFKGGNASRTLQFDLAGYWWRTKDLQLTAVGGVSNSARLLNADHAVGYGVEATVEARPIPALTLTAGGSYNFTEIRDPSISVGFCGSLQCTVTDPIVNGLAVIDGNDLPQAPRFVANVTARYGVPVGDGELFVFTDWAYRSKINYFLYEAKEFRGRALTEGGLKIGYAMNSGLEVAAFARNITNQIRAVSAIDFNNLTGMINEPRIIGGELRFKF
ncbi:TonB-dependent receptor [Sphingomonas endolithica]|uniref:TonB-dependent receptor n=1 Tax=Sphingomonas endolithica TaxID=2972485 RepID=UPI0021AFC05F|nr:TonB-dependent receptor [Sphingomonas sp. ZFBP2030]